MKDFLPRIPPSLYQCGCGINRHKKSPSCVYWHKGLHPAFLALWICYQTPSIGGLTAFTKAGFLAFGSFYSLRLPVSFNLETVAMQISSPITAAGPLPIPTGFPIKPFRAPLIESHIQADRFCQMLKTIFPKIGGVEVIILKLDQTDNDLNVSLIEWWLANRNNHKNKRIGAVDGPH